MHDFMRPGEKLIEAAQRAVDERNVEAISAIIEKTPDNKTTYFSERGNLLSAVISRAAEKNHPEFIDIVLNQESPTIKISLGIILKLAVQNGHHQFIDAFLSKGKENISSAQRELALEEAVQKGDKLVINTILKHCQESQYASVIRVAEKSTYTYQPMEEVQETYIEEAIIEIEETIIEEAVVEEVAVEEVAVEEAAVEEAAVEEIPYIQAPLPLKTQPNTAPELKYRHQHQQSLITLPRSIALFSTIAIGGALLFSGVPWVFALAGCALWGGSYHAISLYIESLSCQKAQALHEQKEGTCELDEIESFVAGTEAGNSNRAWLEAWKMKETYARYPAYAAGKHLAENENEEVINAIRRKMSR